MFGGPPPQQSAEEIQIAEQEGNATVKFFAIAASVLYLSPFAIDYIKKLV